MKEPQQEPDSHWEAQIDALLDDELSDAEISALEHAAAEDPVLAQALIDARQLQQLLGGMPRVPAPRRLRRRLLAIAGPSWGLSSMQWLWLRRAAIIACLPLLVMVARLGDSDQPSAAEISQGRQDLALALSYLDRASRKTNLHISSTINSAMVEPVTQNTVKTLGEQFVLTQEYSL